MKKIIKSPVVFLFMCFTLALLLEACGGAASVEPPTGMDAVSASGRWMTVREPVQDADPQLHVIDLNNGSPWLALPDAEIYKQPLAMFSPSGNYLLYPGSGMWQLVQIASQSIRSVAPTSMNVEFLEDDEILISEHKGTTYEVSRLYPDQETPTIITSNARYIFQSYPDSKISSSSFAGNAPNQAVCPSPAAAASDTHVIVDADGNAWVFAVGSDIRILESTSIKELFAEHESKQQEFALQQLQELQATPGTPTVTEEEKKAYIDLITYSGVSGLVSPDGQHLLILTATVIDANNYKHSLNLINLETEGRTILSSENNWTPAFLFSPDGSQLIYQSNSQGNQAWLSNVDGNINIRLALPDVKTLCWQ